MTLSTLTIISLLLAVYGLVAIIRDIVVGITNAIKRYKANKLYKAMIQDFKEAIDKMPDIDFSKLEIGQNAGYSCAESKRKYKKAVRK